MRLRQQRIKSHDCPAKEEALKVNITTCRSDFNEKYLEKVSYAPGWNPFGTVHTKSWRFEDNINATLYRGEFGSYPSNGYIQYLNNQNKQLFISKLNNLKGTNWIDKHTRVIFVDLIQQNFNINKYLIITVIFEITASGLILPNYETLFLRIHMYSGNLDYFRLCCEILFGLISFFMLLKFFTRLHKNGRKLFYKFWEIHHLLLTLLSLTVVGISIYRLIIFTKIRSDLKSRIPRGYGLRHEALIDYSIFALYGSISFLVLTKVSDKTISLKIFCHLRSYLCQSYFKRVNVC